MSGVDVSLSTPEGGAALTFTAPDHDSVSDLRMRVQHLAGMYEMHGENGHMMWQHMRGPGMGGGMGPGMGGGMGPGMGGGMGPGMGGGTRPGTGPGMGSGANMGMMPRAKATVTEVDNGVRLELVPVDASQLDSLREQLRWHQQRMQAGNCWMWQEPDAPSQ